MFARTIKVGLVSTALLASAAFAQTPTATTDRANMAPAAPAAVATDASSYQGNWRSSKLVGLSVYNENNESVGSINDLLTDKSGAIKAVVIGVGGFLGVGEHLVAVPWDKVKFVDQPVAYAAGAGAPKTTANTTSTMPPASTTTGTANTAPAAAAKSNPWYPDHAVFNATKDQLKAMPEFKYST